MENRYISCMILHAVGDTVGFKNGEWEFMQKSPYEKALEKLYEFIELGGVNNISLKDWIVSDDTIMHLKTAESILVDFSSMNNLGGIFSEKFIEAYEQFNTEGFEKRYPGNSTIKSIKLLKGNTNWDKIPYNINSGGSGASMRTLCIGLAFYGENNRDKLIQISIESSRITNNSTVGYLGGFASALFVALAVEGIKIEEWPFILVDLVESKVKKYIETAGRDISQFTSDSHIFLEKWHRYIDDKFGPNKVVIRRKSDKNIVLRGKYYKDSFGYKLLDGKDYNFIGSGGDDSVILAYDCLLDSGNNWEKLVIYSMMHMGDTDTTGAIAGGLYGILYSDENVPKNFTEHLEYKTELTNIAKKLYNKFYKK